MARLSSLIVDRPWRVIVLWLVLAAVLVPFAPKVQSVTSSNEASFLPSSYESVQAQRVAKRAFLHGSGTSAVFVFRREDGGRLTPADRAAVSRTARALSAAGVARVQRVATGPDALSPDGTIQLAQVQVDGTAGDKAVMDAVTKLRARTEPLVAGSGLRAGLTGDAAVQLDDQNAHHTAEKTVAVTTILLILLLLLLLFRSPLAALLPLVSIALVFGIASSLVGLAGKTLGFHVSLDLPPLMTVVLFGIGTDYILFLLFRYRERLRAGDEHRDALLVAFRRVGHVISFAGLVVIAAFSALGLSSLESLRTMAPGLVISVGVMLLAGLTLVPAILSLIGPRVFWPSKRWRTHSRSGVYARLGRLIARAPGRTALAAGATLFVLAAGALGYAANYDTLEMLPKGSESRQAFSDLRQAFPAGALAPTEIYVTGSKPIDRSSLDRLAGDLRGTEGVAAVRPAELSANRRTARLDLMLKANPYSSAGLDAVAGPIRKAAHASKAGENVLVGGQTATLADVRTATARDYKLIFPVAALVIALLLAVLLRSLVAPLYLMLAVGASFAATLGGAVLTFQVALGQPGLKSSLPVILYLFVVAVGTDYSMLMMTRLREEMLAGASPRAAAGLAVEHGGPAVGAAGIILAGTFGSLLLTGIGSLMQIGFAVSTGILVASIAMATLLVPAVSALLGRRAWWPGRASRPPIDPAAGEQLPQPGR